LALAAELAGERNLAAAAGCGALTGRERDVACLVADHLTNHQIALRLGLSERTVDTHVSHILHKLRISTRGQIADLLRSGQPT
jgi:DNA-binding CsgD family transcriptional regulator